MSNFLSSAFWFNLSPGNFSPLAQKIIIGAVVLFFVLYFVFKALKVRKPGLYSAIYMRLANYFLTNAIILGILFFFNFEIIPMFSARFWYPLWLVVAFVWLFFVLKPLKNIPARREAILREQAMKKYMP